MDDKELVSFGLVDDKGKLTNAGALLADDSPIRWSRVFAQGGMGWIRVAVLWMLLMMRNIQEV